MRKSVIAIILFILVFRIFSNLYANINSHYKAAEELLETMNMGKILQKTIEQTIEMQIQRYPHVAPYRNVMIEFYSKYMSWNSLKNDMIKIYAEEFSEEELRKLAAFYKTSIGQKAIEKLPVLMQKGSQLGAERVQMHADELNKMIQEETEKFF